MIWSLVINEVKKQSLLRYNAYRARQKSGPKVAWNPLLLPRRFTQTRDNILPGPVYDLMVWFGVPIFPNSHSVDCPGATLIYANLTTMRRASFLVVWSSTATIYGYVRRRLRGTSPSLLLCRLKIGRRVSSRFCVGLSDTIIATITKKSLTIEFRECSAFCSMTCYDKVW